MIKRILLAVNDSPPGLDAARVAVQLATDLGASLRAVTVVADGTVADQLAAVLNHAAAHAVASRRISAAHAVLRHVARLAADAAVPCETVELDGEVAAGILEQARSWPADLVVLGRSDLPGPGQPYIGSHTGHVIEFAEQPVLVVAHVRTGQRDEAVMPKTKL